ncbi:methyltransferase domain-containing protein [Agromyces tropicus]|uniref:Methyltransferase domain-containing protein n=1 Tax=Agromyces tropicus TaxID=555371 RepID=A0ABN2TXF6_9MICO
MSIDSTWLRCPNCFADLHDVDDRVFGCDHGHRFDRSKFGYLTLLPPRAPGTSGDDRSMLAARAELLEGGTFAPIADAIVTAASTAAAMTPPEAAAQRLRVADLGCGTGYYSARLADEIPDVDVLLADRSPDAVRMALRAVPDATGVVLDIWRPLPLRDAVADVILDVFAPRNPDEFARVLRPAGRLVVVVPAANHLHQLRSRGMLLDIPPEKDAAVTDRLGGAGFMRSAATRVEYAVDADGALQRLLTGMGPSAHHADALSAASDGSGPQEVTVSVDVLSFSLASR